METQTMIGTQQDCLELRFPLTGNETVALGNNGWYEVYKVHVDSMTRSEIARFAVKQVYGSVSYTGLPFVLEETPITNYGVFLIQEYLYSPGSKIRTIGVSFTPKNAHDFAKKNACRFAEVVSRKEHLGDVINRIDEDILALRTMCV